MSQERHVVIIGAGPAGLTAAYQLAKAGVTSTVLEKDDIVGGISRTVDYKGYLFDIGGHRFFTKVGVVEQMWHEVLSDGRFLRRNRLSRIYYRGRFFNYPLKISNALIGLGFFNSVLIVLSYVKAQLLPIRPEETFEQWVTNRFGRRLFLTFFKTYTEKVWGIPCSEITAEWAGQRIKGLSLLTALKNALFGQRGVSGEVIKTLIDAFDYPARGPGMMWEEVTARVREAGSQVRLEAGVERVFWEGTRVTGVQLEDGGGAQHLDASHVVSTMPVRELIRKMDPSPPQEICEAADRLAYRDFLTVALIIRQPDLFPDNWVYIHDPSVKVGRIQNFKNWSPHMVPDDSMSCLGLEYFCFEGDGLWTMADEDLIALGTKEMAMMGLVEPGDVVDGDVVRMPKAYPVYDSTYEASLMTVRQFLDPIRNLYLVGRNGMHKYNNQDHSMLTAMLAAQNILGADHDIWQVNVDDDYIEEVRAQDGAWETLRQTQPHVPRRRVGDNQTAEHDKRADDEAASPGETDPPKG